ncbi:uncharacterized protein LOC134716888 [Mytilus trossulus]|uniref:uncharacterized protein LOC134716888 n=1 Tax=Mytilus trossulus TaxID=6551 RepID=UPI003005EC7E
MVEQLPTFPSLKSSLNRQRKDLIQHLPTSLLNIDLQNEWTETKAAERFLLINNGTYDKIVVFAPDNNIQHLANNNNNTIYADGTFYTCPPIFEQLYTLHALIDGEMFPLVFALLPGKSEDIYTRFFSLLKTDCDCTQCQIPTTFFIYYKSAVQNSVRSSFLGLDIKGRFGQSTGLVTNYKGYPAIH